MKDIDSIVTEQRLLKRQSDNRKCVRNWEQCCPVPKLALAFGADFQAPTEDERYGFEHIEGSLAKVMYFVKDGVSRPWCYDVVAEHVESIEKEEVLDKVGSDSDSDFVEVLEKKQKKAAAVMHDKSKSLSPLALASLAAACKGLASGSKSESKAEVKAEVSDDDSEDEAAQPVFGFAEALKSLSSNPQSKPQSKAKAKSQNKPLLTPTKNVFAGGAGSTPVKKEVEVVDVGAEGAESGEDSDAAAAEVKKRGRGRPPRAVADLTAENDKRTTQLSADWKSINEEVLVVLPCPETWDANEKLAARKNKFGEKIKKVEAVERKIESFIDKKLKKFNDSKHDKVDELKAEIQEALDKVRVVKSLSKACQTDSPVLSSVVRDLKEAKRLNLTFSRDLVQRFMLWEADEMVRLNDWKGLASLFKKTTVRHDFAVLHDGSVAALMADEENLGLTQEVALSALESHIASMMQNITSEEMAQPTARSPSLSLKNFVTALLEAAESLIAWEQLERSLGIMDVLLSPASCDVVHLENAVQAVTKYSHAELEEMEQEFAKNIMELQQESIVQILMLSSSGGIIVDHAQVVAGRRRREGQLAGKVVELTQTIDDFQLHGSLDARFVAAVQATENLMAPQWKQVLTTSEKVFAKFKVQEARLFEIALKLLKEVVHKVIQTAVDKGRSTSLCITEARVVVCPLRKADMERLVADDVQEKFSQAMKEFYTNAVCDAGALSKAILIIVSGNTAEMEDALRALQSEFTSAMDGVTLHWEEFMDRLRNVCSYALDAAMITVKKTAMSWARREKPATEDTNWIVRQVSSIDTAMTALQRSSRLPTEYFSALGALAVGFFFIKS